MALAAASAFGLALGGCQLIPRADPRPERPPPEPEVERERLPERQPALPPEEDRNRVAVLVPLSGANAGVGTSLANAAKLALLDAGGETIRITVYDTARGPAAAASQAIAEGNGLFLGPLLAEDVRAVAPIARRADVPVIAFSNDESVAGNGVYVVGFTPGQSVSRVVSYARGQGIARFAGVTSDAVYGQRAAAALREAVQESNGRLVGIEAFDRGPGSMRSAILKLGSQGAYEAILIAETGRNAAAAAALIRGGPSRGARILGTELWATETSIGANAALRGAWYAAPSDVMFNQLSTRYRTRYKVFPYRLASLGYDAVLLAVRVGREWRLGRPFPERALRDEGGFTGVDGAFRFRSSGAVERALEVREVTAGGTRVVSPAARDFGR
jgi:ABC-type branched-subunit amino acid transport system substrate-binding protein